MMKNSFPLQLPVFTSLMAKKIGQILVEEDLKRATPSVLMVKDKLAGLRFLHRKPPGPQSLVYSEPL